MSSPFLQILPNAFPSAAIPLALNTKDLASGIAAGNFVDLLKVISYPITIFVDMLENLFVGGVHIAIEIAISLFTIAILLHLIKWMMGEGNINSIFIRIFSIAKGYKYFS
jgi:hypothetical protein